jgi:hypothetical protein
MVRTALWPLFVHDSDSKNQYLKKRLLVGLNWQLTGQEGSDGTYCALYSTWNEAGMPAHVLGALPPAVSTR